MSKQLSTDALFGDDDIAVEPAQKKPVKAPRKAKSASREALPSKTADMAARGKPSPYKAAMRDKVRTRKHFALGQMPTFLIEMFVQRAEALGMNQKEYLYHLMREDGLDVPSYDQLDGRNY